MATPETCTYLKEQVGVPETRLQPLLIGIEQMYSALSLMDEETINALQFHGLEEIMNKYAGIEGLRKIFRPTMRRVL